MQQTILPAGARTWGMRRLIPGLAALAILMSTGGCLSLPSEPEKDTLFDRAGIDAILAASDRQALIMKDPTSKERMCLAPGPDYSVTASRGVNVGMGVGLPVGPKTQENLGGDVSRGALSLGGRNPEVLLARELMYRACELSLNLNADQATTLWIYTRFLESIEKIAQSQTGSGSASVSATPLDPRLQPPSFPSDASPSQPFGSEGPSSSGPGMGGSGAPSSVQPMLPLPPQ